jgi:hypothetical protein
MFSGMVLGREFFNALEQADAAIASLVAKGNCTHCGGPLHRGDYNRKPRGGLFAAAGEVFARRYSLCCGHCRCRALPPSVRFLGRRVYLGAVVIAATTMMVLRAAAAAVETGVPVRTLKRWRGWWQGPFRESSVFVMLSAQLLLASSIDALPLSILTGVQGSEVERIAWLLDRLKPLTC